MERADVLALLQECLKIEVDSAYAGEEITLTTRIYLQDGENQTEVCRSNCYIKNSIIREITG